MQWSNETIRCLNDNITWPASGETILENCSSLPEKDTDVLISAIDPDTTYSGSDEVFSIAETIEQINTSIEDEDSNEEDEFEEERY